MNMNELDLERETMQRRVDDAEQRWEEAIFRVRNLKERRTDRSQITAAVEEQMQCERVVFAAWCDQIALFSRLGLERYPGELAVAENADANLTHLAWLSNAT